MNDLVSNLRDAYAFNRDPLHQRAADHIEELNRALEAYATETIERIDELEAALRTLVNHCECLDECCFHNYDKAADCRFFKARAALEGKDER